MLAGASQQARDENFNTDNDQDNAAQDRRFARKLRAELFAEEYAANTDTERDGGDDQGAYDRHKQTVFRDRKADGKRVDRGGDALQDQRRKADLGFFVLLLRLDAVDQHFHADEHEQNERDPRNAFFKRLKILQNGMHAYPTDHRHQRLKKREHARDTAHFPLGHRLLVQAVGKRNGKRVHSKPDAE